MLCMTRAFLGGDFAALVTPFGSGGIPCGVFCLMREGAHSAGESGAIVAMHSLLTGLFFLIIGAAAAIVMPLSTWCRTLVWSGSPESPPCWRSWCRWRSGRTPQPSGSTACSRSARSSASFARSARHVSSQESIARRRFASSVQLLMRERRAQLALSFLGLFVSRVAIVFCLPIVMYGLGYHRRDPAAAGDRRRRTRDRDAVAGRKRSRRDGDRRAARGPGARGDRAPRHCCGAASTTTRSSSPDGSCSRATSPMKPSNGDGTTPAAKGFAAIRGGRPATPVARVERRAERARSASERASTSV